MKEMPIKAIKWYKLWISQFPESWNQSDLERFYMFVHVLLGIVKKERSFNWLAENLRDDCKKLSSEDIEKYCEIYEHIKDFKKVWKSQQARLIVLSKSGNNNL